MIETHIVSDQLGRRVEAPKFPKRIISLVPSQTELLFDLGVNDRLIGVTKFCIHPPDWLKSKTIIGGTKNFKFDIIEQLQPDLIIGNKEENYLEGISELEKKYPVWMSDIYTINDALDMFTSVGSIINAEHKAALFRAELENDLTSMEPPLKGNALYLIWKSPFMAAGGNTFINEMMKLAGFENVLKSDSRYPEISIDWIKTLHPDYILLSSEPYPFKQKHIEELEALIPNVKVKLVDGEIFSWYGSRMLKARDYFTKLAASV